MVDLLYPIKCLQVVGMWRQSKVYTSTSTIMLLCNSNEIDLCKVAKGFKVCERFWQNNRPKRLKLVLSLKILKLTAVDLTGFYFDSYQFDIISFFLSFQRTISFY